MDLQHARLGQITNVVHDVDAAVQFYRDRLGFKLLFQAGGLAFFDCGGVRLMLSRAETPELDHPGSFLYFKVDDIEATYRTLLERQVAFVDKPHLVTKMKDHELWMTFFHDLDRNPLALMSEVPLK
jgi:catechol 2,3-dioxygenase-like lactoylglutathione lyase family enzyme